MSPVAASGRLDVSMKQIVSIRFDLGPLAAWGPPDVSMSRLSRLDWIWGLWRPGLLHDVRKRPDGDGRASVVVRPRVRAIPRAHERRVVCVLEHRHREQVHLELDLADRREHAFCRELRVAPHELEQRRHVVALLVRRVPREAQHERLRGTLEDHVDFARPRRVYPRASPRPRGDHQVSAL
ncbi:unnamed protein product [Pelagomonas calceolata]|uniref:Uncharacterized protein n=1 Tax=Pelagomonas calceolata TaxID=35677 RepID=A0A8J2X366_9STRA|nr:unnamed protein product [Pelagomonas calceolata]